MRIEAHDLILKAKLVAELASDTVFGDAAFSGRAVEDVINTLIAKGTIVLVDLPEAMRAKLSEREAIRQQIRDI